MNFCCVPCWPHVDCRMIHCLEQCIKCPSVECIVGKGYHVNGSIVNYNIEMLAVREIDYISKCTIMVINNQCDLWSSVQLINKTDQQCGLFTFAVNPTSNTLASSMFAWLSVAGGTFARALLTMLCCVDHVSPKHIYCNSSYSITPDMIHLPQSILKPSQTPPKYFVYSQNASFNVIDDYSHKYCLQPKFRYFNVFIQATCGSIWFSDVNYDNNACTNFNYSYPHLVHAPQSIYLSCGNNIFFKSAHDASNVLISGFVDMQNINKHIEIYCTLGVDSSINFTDCDFIELLFKYFNKMDVSNLTSQEWFIYVELGRILFIFVYIYESLDSTKNCIIIPMRKLYSQTIKTKLRQWFNILFKTESNSKYLEYLLSKYNTKPFRRALTNEYKGYVSNYALVNWKNFSLDCILQAEFDNVNDLNETEFFAQDWAHRSQSSGECWIW